MRNTEKTKDNKNNKLIIIILFLLMITILALGITFWALFFREPDVILSPDWAPEETEGHARPIPGDTEGKMEADEGGGAVSLTYGTNVTIDLSSEQVSLMFANPGKSTQDMVVQVVIQNTVLVQSGRLTPGHQVTTLDLLKGSAEKLSAGGYDGKLVVLYYNPDSGEKAIVNTEIPIKINVVE